MRVVVTLIGPDGTTRRRMVDTAASNYTGPWEEFLARALAALPPYRAVPGRAIYHLRVDDQVALVSENDLSGPLYDLVTAVLAIGDTVQPQRWEFPEFKPLRSEVCKTVGSTFGAILPTIISRERWAGRRGRLP